MEALKRFTGWVGRPKLPPAWVFAPWNDAVLGEENVQRFAEFLRDDSIPTSAIWSEDWKGGNCTATPTGSRKTGALTGRSTPSSRPSLRRYAPWGST